jgi:signal transduction histidine kinase
MKLNYRTRIFFYTLLILSVFTVSVIVVERNRERRFKTEGLESTLDGYVGIIHRCLGENLTDSVAEKMRYLTTLLPADIRVTVINEDGTVVFDNGFHDPQHLENHRERPEIKKALVKKYGSNIRSSLSTGNEYLYYAKHYHQYFVRVARMYDIQLQSFLKSDNIFLYIIVVLFMIVIIALRRVLNSYGKSVSHLKDFVMSVQKHHPLPDKISFPDDELGQIAQSVVSACQQLDESQKSISLEREKLLQHFHHSREGLCFFTAGRKKVYANTHFIQLMNVVINRPSFNPERLFEEEMFRNVRDYLDKPAGEPLFNANISQNGKILNVRVFIFEDGSFEITLNDITKSEKNRLIKQEMTNSIAHELRTPVTSICGFLETMMNSNLDEDTRRSFTQKAYAQIVRLSELIRDVGIITKTEEAPDRFPIEKIRMRKLLDELASETGPILSQHNITFDIDVANSVELQGNRTLIYAIFRNLIDNSMRHGGDNIGIRVSNYTEDSDYYCFSYSDTGKGVGEKHLGRIFERFYRADEGRTRDTGGSGLGLSIVKNSVLFHKGEITAKNNPDGGLEFLFTLRKEAGN